MSKRSCDCRLSEANAIVDFSSGVNMMSGTVPLGVTIKDNTILGIEVSICDFTV